MKTSEQFDIVASKCRRIYELKMKDYGPSWRIMRPQTVNDQLFINHLTNAPDVTLLKFRNIMIESSELKKAQQIASFRKNSYVSVCLDAGSVSIRHHFVDFIV